MNNSDNVLFVWIPKNAGSSIQWSLGLDRFVELDELDRFKGFGRVTFGHIPVTHLIDHGTLNDDFLKSAFKFTFIRNPYDRAVSLFEYSKRIKLVPKSWSFLETVKRVRNGIAKPGLYRSRGFSQWNPQSAFMDGCVFDFIGRVESIQRDYGDLCSKLEIAGRDIAHRNATNREKDYRSYYNTEARTYVEEIYSVDLMRFDYKF